MHGSYLQVGPNVIEIEVPVENLGADFDPETGTTNVNIYTLNLVTGLWERAGKLTLLSDQNSPTRRRKRQSATMIARIIRQAPDLIYDGYSDDLARWINLDVEWPMCYVKVRAYDSSQYLEHQQIGDIKTYIVAMNPPAVGRNEDQPWTWGRRTIGYTDKSDGVCLVTVCDWEDRNRNWGLITASDNDGEDFNMIPDPAGDNIPAGLDYEVLDNMAIKTNLINIDGPPIYFATDNYYYEYGNNILYSLEEECQNAPFDDPHYRFHRRTTSMFESHFHKASSSTF